MHDLSYHLSVPGTDKKLMVEVEVQVQAKTGYSLGMRGGYFCGTTHQLPGYGAVFKNSDYDHISKVYSIWICPKPNKSSEGLFFAYRLENSEKGIRRWLKRKVVGILP